MGGEPRTFFVQPWMTRATAVLGMLQLGCAAALLLLRDVVGAESFLPGLFTVGGLVTLAVAFWTARTPLAKVDAEGVEFRLAMLARPVNVRFADVRSFARLPPGWLVFVAADGSESRVVLTALSPGDADALVALLAQHLTEVSYVEE